MAKKTQSQSADTSNQSTTGQSSQSGSVASSNAMRLEQMKKSQEKVAVENYTTVLGKYLGPKLYQAVAAILTEDKMASLAGQAIESVLRSMLQNLGEQTANPVLQNEALMSEASKQIAQELEALVEDWLGGDSGAALIATLRDWVGANPRMVASLAALAAAGAIIADMDIPTLRSQFKISDQLSASLAANIGSFQNISLENIRAKLEYKGTMVQAAFEAVHSSTQGNSATVSGRLGTDTQHLRGSVTFHEDGVKAYDIGGLYTFADNTRLTGGIGSQNGTDINRINLGISTKSGETTFSGNLNYDPITGTLQAKYDQARSDGLKLGASLSGNTQQGEFNSFGAYMGYQPKGQFDSVMSRYNYNVEQDAHNLSVTGQKEMGDFKLRGSQNFGYSDNNVTSSTNLMSAYEVNDRFSVIGGAEYRHDQQGGRVLPKIGVQYDDVPVIVTYDPANESVSVGISLKF